MSDNDLKVIVKAKELATHTFKLTSNCNRYPKKYRHSLVDKIQIKSLDIYNGNCYKLSKSMDEKINKTLGAKNVSRQFI